MVIADGLAMVKTGLQCHQSICPIGVATHNLRLQKGLVVTGRALWVDRGTAR